MLEKILPSNIFEILKNSVNFSKLFEIRLRSEKPIILNYNSKLCFLSAEGLTNDAEFGLICDKKMIETIILRASNFSIYSVNDDIKKGFITLDGGVRIGLCGEMVMENGQVRTIKNFSSLNIRFPHEVRNCSLNVYNYLIETNRVLNTLIISPPNAGKTTFIRDLCYQFSAKKLNQNVLLLDERNEISASTFGINQMKVGIFTDILTGSTKKVGFENGIRSMAPNVIVADELGNKEDLDAVIYASFCGVSVICSTHASGIYDLKNKANFNEILSKKIFKRFVELSVRNGPGTIEGVFDENFVRIY